ncbi:uncharacterized protein BO97DRAFT_420012 [Aspergillus homomorphus CBS 101889]|uniref:Uncharacterized protein n=1 Tax=Aspergillus homomorphus (strain CBS 101889) TaxID=1450537 RepID=A0A395ICQ8_ASPHC|nr:hypothetical protein BO97DRAFT_420012 [Aspergillus homomorphus CBS 101889]RAL17785.1 hypothetical protein BO97DRAFT_420012 [Aspergillus homomorphus CBS 101889]
MSLASINLNCGIALVTGGKNASPIMIDTALATFDRIDYCVHSAGIASHSRNKTETLDIDTFDATMATNKCGTMLVLRAVPHVHTPASEARRPVV